MKSFLVLLKGKQSKLDQELLESHTAYLKQLYNDGHLITCGPFKNNGNALIILKTETRQISEELVRNDPFIKESYYESFIINEFLEANDANDWQA